MCAGLSALGVETCIVTTDADGEGRLSVPIGKWTSWNGVQSMVFKRNFSESFKYSRGLARWLSAHIRDFDVIHIHAVLSHACLSASAACRRAGVPYVMRPLGTLASWSLGQKAFKKRLLLAAGGARAINHAAAIHCTSDEERASVNRIFPGARCVVIPLGIDDAFLRQEPVSWTERLGRPYVLALSRLHPKKNIEALIEAFVAAPRDEKANWRLVLAGTGDDDYVESLRRLVRARNAEARVQFAGWVEGKEKRELIRHASLFALVSFHENFGVSLLEALACGVPALVSRHVDLAGVVRDAAAGWVVDTPVASLASGLDDALSQTIELEARGLAARGLAKRYAWPDIAAQLVDLYQRVHSSSAPLAADAHPSAVTVRH
jgi:glycosyltransferase involved in cell wall biosynthesis